MVRRSENATLLAHVFLENLPVTAPDLGESALRKNVLRGDVSAAIEVMPRRAAPLPRLPCPAPVTHHGKIAVHHICTSTLALVRALISRRNDEARD